jgi:hypothetical protein
MKWSGIEKVGAVVVCETKRMKGEKVTKRG